MIELAIVIAVLGILLALGLPALTDWITNTRIRTAAEGVVNGLQLARAEAIRGNTLVDLQIDADGVSWNVVVNGATAQTRGADAGSGIIATPTGPLTVTFNSLGRMTSPASFAIRYTSGAGGTRAMCATVLAHTPRLCDPQRTDITDPQACYLGGVFVAGC